MSLTLTIQLSDRDLEHFTKAIEAARVAAEHKSAAEVMAAATALLATAQASQLPDFIADRLDQLDTLVAMVKDEGWALPEVDAKRVEVSLPKRLLSGGGAAGPIAHAPKRASHGTASGPTSSGNAVKAPMQSTVVKVAVAVGDTVAEGDLVIVLEAMKMEQPMNAHKAGTIKSISAVVGETVPAGTVLLELE